MINVGIISEFNPFHNGHKYLIDKARTLTNCDNIVSVCSGNYVQRGLPAIFPKQIRTSLAIENGIDLLIELPIVYSLSDAGLFAKAAVRILDKLNVIDYLIFGTEHNNIDDLLLIAVILYNEPNDFKNTLKLNLSSGQSYPLARQNALNEYCKNNNIKIDIDSIISGSNNILAIEYLIALKTFNSKIKPICIKRVGDNYNDEKINSDYPSATAIRNYITQNKTDSKISLNYPDKYICLNDYSSILGFCLTGNISGYSINDELKNRIKKKSNNYIDFESFSKDLYTKNTTYSSTLRSLFHLILSINHEIDYLIENDYIDCAIILGFNRNSSILSQIKEKGNINLVSKMSDYIKNCSALSKTLMNINLRGDELYRKVYMNKYKIYIPNELERQIVIKK